MPLKPCFVEVIVDCDLEGMCFSSPYLHVYLEGENNRAVLMRGAVVWFGVSVVFV